MSSHAPATTASSFASTPVSTATTTTAAAISSGSGSPSQSSGGPTNLYLFTFLATLCLLLLLSSSVTLRAVLLRRRIQRQIALAAATNALADGAHAPGHASRRYRASDKPKFHDAWIAPGGENWETIMPIAVQFLPSKSRRRGSRSRGPPPPPPRTDILRSARNLFSRSTPPLPPPPPSEQVEKERPPSELQISVLVAMPSSHSPSFFSTTDDIGQLDDSPVPSVVIGVAQIPYSRKSGDL